jgi:glucose-6-phosphate 1-dehydrogenase
MVQNHMLQVLSLIAMEPPSTLEADAIRGQKVEVLRALQHPAWEPDQPSSVRGRYAKGEIGGRAVEGYLEELGVAPDSRTETYVALRAHVENWRWSGVPFLLRHGKRMPRRFTEVQVQFHTPPLQLFNRPTDLTAAEYQRMIRSGEICHVRPNVLSLRLQPEEAIGLSFGVKQPGNTMDMTPATMHFDYADHFGESPPDAYERLLADTLLGDQTLFLRGDEIEASWQYADSVLAEWQGPDGPPIEDYAAGSWGPSRAEDLFGPCQGSWSRG